MKKTQVEIPNSGFLRIFSYLVTSFMSKHGRLTNDLYVIQKNFQVGVLEFPSFQNLYSSHFLVSTHHF